MGAFSDTPVLLATGTILPYRFVKLSGENKGAVCAAGTGTNIVVGVTDGSTKAFNNGNHCESGDPITLQGGDVVLIEASDAITYGVRVVPTTDGKGVACATTATFMVGYVALETAAAAGAIIRCYKTCSAISA